MQFSPKILGLNVEILGTILDSPGLDFRTVFGQFGTEFLGLFLDNPMTNYCFCILLIKKMNNMLVMCKLCYYMRK